MILLKYIDGRLIRLDGKSKKDIFVIVSESGVEDIIPEKEVPALTKEQLQEAYNQVVNGAVVIIASELGEYFIVKQACEESDNPVIYFDYANLYILRYELDEEVEITAKAIGEGGSSSVFSVNGQTGVVVLTAEDIKLSEDDTTSIKQNLDSAFEALNNKENSSNKVNSLADATDNVRYLGAKVVKDELQNVREVAEGKCKSIVISCTLTAAEIKSSLQALSGSKAVILNVDGTETDIKADVISGSYDNLIMNSDFNTQDNTIAMVPAISTQKYLVVERTLFDYVFYPRYKSSTSSESEPITISDILKQGDLIYVKELDVPDRWIYVSGGLTAYKLETSKVDLSEYAKISELENKVDKETGKGLSTNDFTTAYKNNVDSNTTARHTHSNKSVLDNITSNNLVTSQEKATWNAKSNATNLENGTGVKALVQKESATFTLNGVTYNVDATEKGASAFGGKTAATGSRSFASGSSTAATGPYSHTEGANTLASGNQSHAEGNQTIASGTSSHAEGVSNEASNIASHAEGQDNFAQSTSAHAEGQSNIVYSTALQAHAEGWKNSVKGNSSHVEGAKNYIGENAADCHVTGSFNISKYANQTVVGTVNDNKENTLFEVGNGDVLVDPETITNNEKSPSKVTRSNAFEVYKDGHAEVQSGMKIVNGNLQIGNTTLTEAQLIQLLTLLN